MSIIEKLTEGVVRRNTQKEGEALLNKWEKTGLLEGINSEHTRNGMAALLENQAKEILREASTMATGDVEGFAAVAFPIVRRVFGGLVANELVSVQPMSLPSGLIFFLDFTYGGNSDSLNLGGYTVSASVYGGGRIASQITAGVDLDGANAETSFYALNNGYASPVTQSATITNPTAILSGTVGSGTGDDANGALSKAVQFDADLSASTVVVATMALSNLTDAQFNEDNFVLFWKVLALKLLLTLQLLLKLLMRQHSLSLITSQTVLSVVLLVQLHGHLSKKLQFQKSISKLIPCL
jgi:hypothetical protein